MANGLKSKLILGLSLLFIVGCASKVHEEKVKTSVPKLAPKAKYSGPKMRLAVSSFEDKSGYGTNMFGQIDALGDQAADMLSTHLIQTDEFIVLERQNLQALEKENKLSENASQFIGVSALIFGSVIELGTKTEWQDAGLSKEKIQTAHAKVAIRLVDPKTGVAFYSEFGEANANKSSSTTLGFGGKSSYDATLTDKALNAAIAKLMGNILNNLRSRPWQASVLDTDENGVYITAGKRMGIKVGQTLKVFKPGKQIKNKMTGAMIQLPGTEVGMIQVISQFGSSDLDEGSICTILSGTDIQKDYIVELMEGQK